MAYKNTSVIGTPVEHRSGGKVSHSSRGTPLHHTVKAPWPPQVKAPPRATGAKPCAPGVLILK